MNKEKFADDTIRATDGSDARRSKCRTIDCCNRVWKVNRRQEIATGEEITGNSREM
jgi:hypothetical protein